MYSWQVVAGLQNISSGLFHISINKTIRTPFSWSCDSFSPLCSPAGSSVCVPWWVDAGWVSSCGSRGDRQWWLRTTGNWWRRHNWSGYASLRHTVLLWWPSTVREECSFKDHITEESWWHEASASSQHLRRRAAPGWECSSLGGS